MIFEVVKIVVKISKLIKNRETLTAETFALQRFAGFEKFYPNDLHPAPKPRERQFIRDRVCMLHSISLNF